MNGKKVILKIGIKDGKFVTHRGAKVTEFSEDFVDGNGWRCKYFPDGSIRCKAYIPNEIGEKSITFKISKYGYVCLFKKCDDKKTELRRFKLHRWPVDGTISLTDGELDERYAYFQDEEYLEFLRNNHIYAVKKEDPNHLYTLWRCFSLEEKKNVQETILTDGEIKEQGKNEGRTSEWEQKYPESYSFEEFRVVKICGATWVIITTENFDDETIRRTLHSLTDISELKGIPRE